MLILDGRRVANERAPLLRSAAESVRVARGRAPSLLLVAFGDGRGGAPHVRGKLRACEAASVAAVPLIVERGAATASVVSLLEAAVSEHRPDGVFVQVPFPPDLDGDVVCGSIPVDADIDLMTDERYHRYMSGADEAPPLTVEAGLLLLDAYGVSVRGLRGVVIAGASPFAEMFREALRRRGAEMEAVLDPDTPDLQERLEAAELVVVSAGRPGIVGSDAIAPGAVALDVGYFNEGGRGDIDVPPGTSHLSALMPVPGGIGPMTVSVLVERVIEAAAGNAVR